MRLWGAHNRRNVLAAAAAARCVPGVTWAHVLEGRSHAGTAPPPAVPWREVGGVLYVDDSNATTPQSAAEALEAVPRPAVVLAGGKPKGVDVGPLIEALARRARAVVTLGTSGPALLEALRGRVRAEPGGPDMASAVRIAAALARRGTPCCSRRASPAWTSTSPSPPAEPPSRRPSRRSGPEPVVVGQFGPEARIAPGGH